MAKNAITDWSTTAASNTDVGGVNIDEGCAPSGINNAIRELMAQVATGLGNGGFVDSIDQLTVLTTPADGDAIALADTSDSETVKKVTLANLRKWLGTPIGAVMPFAGSSAPSGWLLCYGQAISRTTYSDLFAAISTTYGVGDGSTTFNLPDLRGRVVAGKDNMGGTSANRLTDQSGGLDGDTLGDTGGSETHTLTEGETLEHQHFSYADESRGVTTDPVTASDYPNKAIELVDSLAYRIQGTDTVATIGLTSAFGGSGAHNNVQPTIILNHIIFAGV